MSDIDPTGVPGATIVVLTLAEFVVLVEFVVGRDWRSLEDPAGTVIETFDKAVI